LDTDFSVTLGNDVPRALLNRAGGRAERNGRMAAYKPSSGAGIGEKHGGALPGGLATKFVAPAYQYG